MLKYYFRQMPRFVRQSRIYVRAVRLESSALFAECKACDTRDNQNCKQRDVTAVAGLRSVGACILYGLVNHNIIREVRCFKRQFAIGISGA